MQKYESQFDPLAVALAITAYTAKAQTTGKTVFDTDRNCNTNTMRTTYSDGSTSPHTYH
jgi:hypothetical protein